MHGYGIARRIEQISGDRLQLNQGTIYPAMLNLDQMGWISSKWGVSENNRRAKYFSITRTGKRVSDQLSGERRGVEEDRRDRWKKGEKPNEWSRKHVVADPGKDVAMTWTERLVYEEIGRMNFYFNDAGGRHS